MAGKLASGREAGHGVDMEAGVRYQAAGFGDPPPSTPHALPCALRDTADAVGMKAG
jgi:hypothetical protein